MDDNNTHASRLRWPSLTVASRLAGAVVLLVLMFSVLGVVSTVALQRAVRGFDAASVEAERTQIPVVKLRATFPQNKVAALQAVLSVGGDSTRSYYESVDTIEAGFTVLLGEGVLSVDLRHDVANARLSWAKARGIIEEQIMPRGTEVGAELVMADRSAAAVSTDLTDYARALSDADTLMAHVESAGDARLTERVAEAKHTRDAAQATLVAVCAAGALVSVVGGWRTRSFIVGRLRALSNGFAALRAGELHHRVPVAGRDEFARVSESFNAMASVIEDSRASLAHQALHDGLTGLANRVLLADRIDHARLVRGAGDHTIGLLVVDLDGFKQVNDTLGHQCGDTVLVTVAERLRQCVRAGDTVARLGGDEFAVLLTDLANRELAGEIAARMVEAVARPINCGAQQAKVGASIGVAFADVHVSSAGDLLRNADLAMYAAKEAGKGRWQSFEATMHEQSVARAQLEAELRDALDREEFVVHYQPVVGLGDGEVTGFEALVRWSRPGWGVVPPDEFIPLAEETGLIIPLGRVVLFEACARLGRWNRDRQDRPPLRMAVNVSARQLHDADLERTVSEAVQQAGIDPSWLVLELTETALVTNPERARERLAAIRALGVRISIDDFGTGYSSLSYLQAFPLDEIKIDRSFVRALGLAGADGAPPSPGDRSIVAAVIGMAHAFGYEVVAEGVESAEQLAELVGLGCESGQGYLWAKPLPGAESARIAQVGLGRDDQAGALAGRA